ncbi:adenylate/guanylate cyclase domain-containing protein [Actinomyces sp. MRS3W]|uniref:adenylate/guanylate cyclase domain-containing protein n=1 Tax=Actinomyces sp. MRS3W TaxID=2800796 RepID=UPI0028FD0B1B|nr:adenylate/guanylate cyclase domain-containing protein [Actinomyces sp. MRS3W]MDU0348013.1 adenylate/guanylate cyclase domain-containing protein [Actinomyces sp. MRS3W]
MTDQQTPGARPAPGDPGSGEATSQADTSWSTVSGHEQLLLKGTPTLSMRDLASRADTGLDLARRFWRAMGFADVDPDEIHFTEQDVVALRTVADLIDDTDDGLPSSHAPGGGLAASSVLELLRAQSFTMDRLVLWQLETLVSDISQRFHLDDTAARLVALDHVNEMIDSLSGQLVYVWRRHLASLLGRTDAEVSRRGREDAGPDYYPLIRSLGFVDIVSFTQRAQTMSRQELSAMLDDFESTARDVVTSRGARVVKTIGDAVMYIADDLTTAADVVTALVAELQSSPEMMRVRASLVQGRVVSRSGDVFGPPVNLASRLVDTAEPGGIRMDEATARDILNGPDAHRYRVHPCHDVVAKGLGNVTPWALALA